ncbi:MAG: ATP-dependent DNA helicase [Oscillospiraceae bacterium]|nr:ATP-dependent DNA helicase [Oscillospiraceae bacterium]
MNEPVYMADIQNKLYEAGLLRPEERVVLLDEGCALLEYHTGKTYTYRMVELESLQAKRLFNKPKPLNESGYQRAKEKMLSQFPCKPPKSSILTASSKERARNLLNHIFRNILPAHGMDNRENQIDLALEMLQALQENRLALCEAEVGTGKTHAYILAVTVYNLFHENKLPTIISTSTIALQKALTEEYIPQISEILMEHRIIDKPLSFIVRKGKSHYACDSRVKGYRSSIAHNDRLEDQELLSTLTKLFTGACPLDLDNLPLTDYVKSCINVERCHLNCDLSAVCRYREFTRKAQTLGYDFQISNHNLVLADVLSRKNGRKSLLPPRGVVVFDEAHKLLDAARQMYGMTLENVEIERLAASLFRATGVNNPDKGEIVRLCETLLEQNSLLFEALKYASGRGYDKSCYTVQINFNCIRILKTLMAVLRRLSVLFYTTSREKRERYDRLVSRMERLDNKLSILFHHPQSILWLEMTGAASGRVCALPKQLDYLLAEDIWSEDIPYILTSGTLSIGGDFTHFKRNNGIVLAENHRILETSKASPFDYQSHALLYLPQDMPAPVNGDSGYFEAMVSRIIELIYAAHGHTMILFTSYRMMEQVHNELSREITEFPLYRMGKGRLDALDAFRNSRNGVLFASDSAGEGIDLAGDILSSLIVVRLPFPTPDPVLEYEKTLYPDFYAYLNQVVVPGMLIKLRQWIGRGIRRESDTCVFSILDSRAGRRYKNDILSALPDMPVTDRLLDVSHFIRSKKDNAYFE